MEVKVLRQITVAAQNRPGQLAALCRKLAEHDINIEGISVIDSIEQGVLRLVTSDPEVSARIFRETGFYVIEADVLILELVDRVGQLAQVSQMLGEAGINLDYVYGTASHSDHQFRMVLKVSDLPRALDLLRTQ